MELIRLFFVHEQVSVEADEAKWIAAAQAGDASAFGWLVLRYQERLIRSVLHLIPQEEQARDICQEAFLNAYQNLNRFRLDSSFYTWIYRIAFNAAISWKRRRRPLQTTSENDEYDWQEHRADLDPGHYLEQNEQARQVRAALAQLGEERRVILVMKDLEDKSYEEIASLLDIPIGTVRSRLFRAREELKSLLEMEEQRNERPT